MMLAVPALSCSPRADLPLKHLPHSTLPIGLFQLWRNSRSQPCCSLLFTCRLAASLTMLARTARPMTQRNRKSNHPPCDQPCLHKNTNSDQCIRRLRFAVPIRPRQLRTIPARYRHRSAHRGRRYPLHLQLLPGGFVSPSRRRENFAHSNTTNKDCRPCLSKICDATGYSLYIDSYSSCVAQGGAAPQTTGATKTADAPATTPPPTLTGAGAGLPSSTTKPNAGSRGGVPTSVALLAALFVWSVVW